jgi:hypothetical protein
MRPVYLPAGGDDIDKLGKAITKIDDDIGEADLKANSNDPIERAYWRSRAASLQSEKLILRSEKLILQDRILQREKKETLREEQETLRTEQETLQLGFIARRDKKETDEIEGLIRLGKIGDTVTVSCFAVSKY